MASDHDIDAAMAGIGLLGNNLSRVARTIGHRLPLDWDDPESLALVDWGRDLTPRHLRRLRAYLWRYGVVIYGLRFLSGAFQLRPIAELRAWRRLAERWPEARHCGFAFAVFARLWRSWLRLRGLHHRIGRTALAMIDVAGGAACTPAVRTCANVTADPAGPSETNPQAAND